MARKRASLKDKGTEVLRPAKKSRGIDLLFGESTEEGKMSITEAETSGNSTHEATVMPEVSQPNPVAEANQEKESMAALEDDRLGGLDDPAMPAAETEPVVTLPVNEADVGEPGVVATEAVVDELGLPVAMEAPPADLVMAGSVTEARSPAGDTVVAPALVQTGPADENDLSGLAGEIGEDLSGLASEEADLSGLMVDEPANFSPATNPSPYLSPGSTSLPGPTSVAASPAPVVITPTPAASPARPLPPAPAPPPVKPAVSSPPAANSSSSTRPAPFSPAAATSSPVKPAVPSQPVASSPFSSQPAPSSPAGASQLPQNSPFPPANPAWSAAALQPASMPSARIESLGGVVTEQMQVLPQNILPEDIQNQQPTSNIIAARPPEEEVQDERLSARVARFVGRERREKLDKEIELLYDRVDSELSNDKDDTEFALETLCKAQDMLFENPSQYDEAFRLAHTVKSMLARKRNLARWSYTWGLFIFFYAVVWLVIFIAGFLLTDQMRSAFLIADNTNLAAVVAAWFSALAGGIGGGIGILYSLYWRISYSRDFTPQYYMYYLVQPIMGFFLGAVIYFVVAAGFLFLNFAATFATNTGTGNTSEVLSSTTVIAIQVLFGWIAGFRQKFVFETIDKIVQRISSRPDDTRSSQTSPLAPTDQVDVVKKTEVKTTETTDIRSSK